ncbi:8291_t:CDS:1 [Ambispora leptoticha]|uniref:8291_t:CDS:1 n=1 Tax=Ambispora leptoticha TaxID=144679 RepID=A0A9N9BEW8_9GLOM|nr:8291_t:CDS:1 [Ambispora leptoticha]
MTSLEVSGIAPFLDFAGLLMFVQKISIYLLIGATFYYEVMALRAYFHASPSKTSTSSIIPTLLHVIRHLMKLLPIAMPIVVPNLTLNLPHATKTLQRRSKES